MYSENTDCVRPNILDVNTNSSVHENQISTKKPYVGNTDELDSQEAANMSFNLKRVQDSDSGRDLGEEMANDNDVDVAWNIGNEGHVKSIISKLSLIQKNITFD